MIRLLTTAQFAELAAISARKARQALQRAVLGNLWRGNRLSVEVIQGRGGRRGVQYQVRVDSLPLDLQDRLKVYSAPVSNNLEGPCDEATRRLNIIAPIIAHPNGPERRATFKAVTIAHPDISEETLYRWIRSYEKQGVAGLARKRRVDKGASKCVISAAWFNAVASVFDTNTIERIDLHLRTYVRSMIAAGESPKRTQIRAGAKLRELTIAGGHVVTADTSRRVFDVPRRYVTNERLFGKVPTRDRDAKAHHDQRPAIIRKLAAAPNEFSIDAMHFDHIVCREDGTPAYPKAIVWMCHATNRLRLDTFLLGPREGIRMEHVAASIERGFEEWGVPQRLTIDNGGEFNAVPDLTDILQLIGHIDSVDRKRPIVRAQPYNARGKPVENGIGVLQRVWLSGLPGHVGNNRINRKTQQVGRPTSPFPGSFELFEQIVQMRVREYNAAPQRGRLKGRSPDEAYGAHVEAGFTLSKVDRASLIIAFSKRDKAKVQRGNITVSGRVWTCSELDYRSGEWIGVLKGRFYDWPMVPLYDLSDESRIIGYAEPNEAVDGNNPANARHQKQRERRYNARVRELAKIAPPADLIADTIASAPSLPAPAQAPTDATIIPTPQAAKIVAAVTEPKEVRESRRRRKAEAEHFARITALQNDPKTEAR